MSGVDRGRAMIYPYTIAAKVAQFPYKFYFKNNWIVKYWVFGCILTAPVMIKISNLSNSPGNIAKYEESKRKEAAAHH